MRHHRDGLALAATALIVAALGALLCLFFERDLLAQSKSRVMRAANQAAISINQNLTQHLNATYALAALVKQGRGQIQDFDGIAKEFLGLFPGISALQLAPGGIIKHISPLAGNEKAIGHNLLADEQRNKEALLAIRTGKLTLAGPFELIQGGEAIIGRLPIFFRDSPGNFWGFSTALLKMKAFLRTTPLDDLSDHGYSYRLWRIHPDTGAEHIFARSRTELQGDPVVATIEVPNGRWFLSLTPTSGWFDSTRIAIEGLIVLLITALATWAMHRELVARRTQKDNERILRAARDAAAAANQTKSDILTNLGHEVCTPLNGMMGMAELLDTKTMSDADRDNLEQIKRCGLQLQTMLERMIEFARLQAGETGLVSSPFNLPELLQGQIHNFQPRAIAKGLALSLDTSDPHPKMLVGDGKRLQQILDELLSNALSFTETGAVSLRAYPAPNGAGNGLLSMVFEVSDHGCGIAPEFHERIFEAFSQAAGSGSRRYGGLGLGLALCKSIVNLMGGQIEVNSAPGSGSTFRVTLPFMIYQFQN